MIPLGICVRLFQACITRCNANKSRASDNTLASSEQRFGLHPAGDGCSPNIGDESRYGSKLHRFRTQFVGPAEDMFFSDSFVIFTLRPSACTHLDLGKSSTWEPKVYQPNIVLCSTTIHFPLNVFFGLWEICLQILKHYSPPLHHIPKCSMMSFSEMERSARWLATSKKSGKSYVAMEAMTHL